MDWISVKDKLPEYYVPVWVKDKYKYIFLGKMWGRSYNPPKKYWRNLEKDEEYPLNSTHWLPLEPPEEK